MARPRKHDRPALVKAICAAVSGGALVKVACEDAGIDRATLHRWVEEDEAFRNLYARAREDQAHALAEQALSIAHGDDDLTIEREEAIDEEESELEKVADPQRYQKIRALRLAVITRDKLRVDALKWMASKIAPRTYGEKIQQEVSGELKGAETHYVILGGQKVAF